MRTKIACAPCLTPLGSRTVDPTSRAQQSADLSKERFTVNTCCDIPTTIHALTFLDMQVHIHFQPLHATMHVGAGGACNCMFTLCSAAAIPCLAQAGRRCCVVTYNRGWARQTQSALPGRIPGLTSRLKPVPSFAPFALDTTYSLILIVPLTKFVGEDEGWLDEHRSKLSH